MNVRLILPFFTLKELQKPFQALIKSFKTQQRNMNFCYIIFNVIKLLLVNNTFLVPFQMKNHQKNSPLAFHQVPP